MSLDWRTPFEFAFELSLFLVGSILVLLVALIASLIIYALIKAFFMSFSRASKKNLQKDADDLNERRGLLKPIK
jgi:membrane protein implicated in regulation of membrane protease activity